MEPGSGGKAAHTGEDRELVAGQTLGNAEGNTHRDTKVQEDKAKHGGNINVQYTVGTVPPGV